MVTKERADQVAGGVFLIGLGLLFTNVLPFWPGILFVIGASTIAREASQGHEWRRWGGGLGIIAVGVLFLFGFSWPLLLIAIGVGMLFTYKQGRAEGWWGACDDHEDDAAKRKNDDKPKRELSDDEVVRV